MSKFKVGNKAYRTLDFILGARNPAVLRALAPFGFTSKELTEGVDLLKEATTLSLTLISHAAPEQARLVERMDAFENVWFPVVRGSLARHFPAIADSFFENLSQSQGKGTTFGLITFVSRLDALGAGVEPFAKDGVAARELLASRGLSEEVEAQAQALVDEISASAPEVSAPRTKGKDEAEAELWAWYLEWSAIARVAINSNSMLRGLGFRKRRRSDVEGGAGDSVTVSSVSSDSKALTAASDSPAKLEAAPAAPQLPAAEEGGAVAAE